MSVEREIRTELLNLKQLHESVHRIEDFLQSWGQATIRVMYGFDCNLPIDQLWKPIEIQSAELNEFIERSEAAGVYVLGSRELHIEGSQDAIRFTLCHESDIHFVSSNQLHVNEVIAAWRQQGFVLYVADYIAAPERPREWERLG